MYRVVAITINRVINKATDTNTQLILFSLISFSGILVSLIIVLFVRVLISSIIFCISKLIVKFVFSLLICIVPE